MDINNDHRPTQAIINLTAIQQNIHKIQSKLPPGQLIYASVKADGYGHGAVQTAKAALEAGIQGIAVATVDEAIELRQADIVDVPIHILGLTDPRGIAEILHYQLTVTVSGTEFFQSAYEQLVETQQLELLDRGLTFHLALDTGMGRIGLRELSEIEEFAAEVTAYPWAEWEGVFTHFATASGGPEEYVAEQYQRWEHLLKAVPAEVTYRHIANSAMAIWYNDLYPTDIVRLGIAMYGIDPKDQQDDAFTMTLEPALSLVSEIIYVKQVAKHSKISYGASYEAQADEWIATIPIGYADGWLRHYQVSPIIVDGQACEVVGVINMDQLMIRLPKYYPIGTTVTLIGQDGTLNNHVSSMAAEMNTIGYEILTSIGPRVPRIYLNDVK